MNIEEATSEKPYVEFDENTMQNQYVHLTFAFENIRTALYWYYRLYGKNYNQENTRHVHMDISGNFAPFLCVDWFHYAIRFSAFKGEIM